jgi:hypothetical protein
MAMRRFAVSFRMAAPRRPLARALLVLLGALQLALAGCRVAPPVPAGERPVRAFRVEVDDVREGARGRSGFAAQAGDYVLWRGPLRILVGGPDRPPAQRGALIALADASRERTVELGVGLAPSLALDGELTALDVDEVGLVERGDGPAVRVEAAARAGGRDVYVALEYGLGRVPGLVTVTMRIESEHALADARFGAWLTTGGAPLFVPGSGAVEPRHGALGADFVALADAERGLALAFARSELSATAEFERHGESALIHHAELVERGRRPLAARRARYAKLLLASDPGGMGWAVRALGHARGRPHREAWLTLPYRPSGAEVVLLDDDERPLVRSGPDAAGRVVLPLPAGAPTELHAVATAFGHGPSDPLVIHAGAHGRLDIPRGGQIRLRVRDGADERPVAARARIIGIGGTRPVELGPVHRAAGAGDVVVMLAGEADVPVPPGKYQVVVTHGPAFTARVEDVEVTATYAPRVLAELTRSVALDDQVACDLHVHAEPSPDSRVSLADRLTTLAAEDVDFAVPTDHNHVTDYGETAYALDLEGFTTVSGVEVTTWAPNIGHFNAYPLAPRPALPNAGAPAFEGLTPGALFASLHALDPAIVVQVNHPRLEGGIGYFDIFHVDPHTGAADPGYSPDYDAVEVWNGFDLGRADVLARSVDEFLALVARGQRLAATGSSDSHQVLYQVAGYPRTMALTGQAARRDPAAIVAAIKRGQSYVTSGPFVRLRVQNGGPGDTVRAESGVVLLSVEVRAAPWVPTERLAIYVGTERVHTLAMPAPEPPGAPRDPALRIAVRDLPLTVSRDDFVTVRVESGRTLDHYLGRGAAQSFAFTSPVYVDADGDGLTPWSAP